MKRLITILMSFVMAISILTVGGTTQVMAAAAQPNLEKIALISNVLRQQEKNILVDGDMMEDAAFFMLQNDAQYVGFGVQTAYDEKCRLIVVFNIDEKTGDVVDDMLGVCIMSNEGHFIYEAEVDLEAIVNCEVNKVRQVNEKTNEKTEVTDQETIARVKKLAEFGLKRIDGAMNRLFNLGISNLIIPPTPDVSEEPDKPVTPEDKTIKAKAVTLSATSYEYTGKAICPAVTVTDENGKKIDKNNYTVSYSNNKSVGKATVKVTCKGNYTGTLSASFKINPKGTKLTAIKKKSGKLEIKWKKQATQTTGYEIWYSTDKKFKKSVTKLNVKKNKTVKATSKKINKKKTYYVKIRSYKTVNGVKYYSKWSAVMKK